MPIYLPAPTHSPLGVDGNGWNRMAIHGMCNDECALRPKTMTAFLDALDTRRATYGMYDHCLNNGECGTCSLLNKETNWNFFADEMLIRVDEAGRPWLMNRPDNGWEEFGKPVEWQWLLTIKGPTFKRHKDKYSDGIMMTRVGV